MKYVSIILLILASSFAHAETNCNSEKNGEGQLLTLDGKNLMLDNVQTGDVVLFANKTIKVVDFYVTGGPEQGITVVTNKGVKFDIWCSDENTPTDD